MYSKLNTTAHKLMPVWMYSRLIGNWNKDGLKKYLRNTSWVFVARIFSYATSFITIAVVARYLGPENLGTISYLQSFTILFSIFGALGIDAIISRDIISQPEKEHIILGTAARIKLVLSIVSYTATTLTAHLILEPNQAILVAILALPFLLGCISGITETFAAHSQHKYIAQTGIYTAFILTILKLAAVGTSLPLIYFVTIAALEGFIGIGILLYYYIYTLHKTVFEWRFSATYAMHLLVHMLPFSLISIAGVVNARTDQIMIGSMLGSEHVGYYTAAVQVTEAWFVFPILILTTLYPALINARKTDSTEYIHRLRTLIIMLTLATTSAALLVVMVAPLIISILYGSKFTAAIPLLQLYSFVAILSTLVSIFRAHLVAENRTRSITIATIISAGSNIVLNFLFIPVFGVTGAIIATLLSYLIMIMTILLDRKTSDEIIRGLAPHSAHYTPKT